jgi:RHS repeat-associated protein
VQGNLANKDGTQYAFDYGNRLRTVTYNAATVEAYQYDGHGRRVLATSPAGAIVSFYSQGGQLVYQDDQRDGKTHSYFYLAGSLVNELTHDTTTGANANRFQHTDALGSPVVVTNGPHTVLERREYEPYGRQLTPTPGDGPGYTGHMYDAATGLVYMQQRYYDPMGRFLSVDAVTAYEKPITNFCRYCYAANNPYKFTDPDGREVFVVIKRDTYTNNSVTSTISVTSDMTDKSFSGYTLEDSRGGQNRDKDPIRADSYAGSVRTDGKKGWRIELEPKNNYKNVQIHAGNSAEKVEGCFAAGTGRSENWVSNSKQAMSEIRSVVDADGSGKITVVVQGSSTPPPIEPPPPPTAPTKDQLN